MRVATETLPDEIAEVPHGCLSPRPSPGATQREMRAAPARALSPRPTTTTAASPCLAARRAATAVRAARSEYRGESGTSDRGRSAAEPRVASVPTAPPRPPKQARAVLFPFYAADARPAPPPPAPSPWGLDGPPGATGVLSGRGGRKRGPLVRSSNEVMHLMQGCHCALLLSLIHI